MMNFDYELYRKIIKEDREVTKQMVINSELSEEDAWLRDEMRKDEILDMFD